MGEIALRNEDLRKRGLIENGVENMNEPIKEGQVYRKLGTHGWLKV